MNTTERIQKIFKEKFYVEIPEEYFTNNISLGSTGLGLGSTEMFYFVHFVESEFNIKFTREHFVSGAVRNFATICQTINELVTETVPELEKIAE